MSTCLLPLAPHLHQLIPQIVLVLLGFVGVQLAVWFGIRFGVVVGWVRDEGIRMEGWRLGFPVNWRYDCCSLVTVDGAAALAWDFD